MVEQQKYEVVGRRDGIEFRRYAPCTVAEVQLTGDPDQVPSRGFGYLFGYISGGNTAAQKIAMTAPVVLSGDPQRAAWHLGFVMPAGARTASLPIPRDSAVRLVDRPAETAAVVRFSGRSPFARVQRIEQDLLRRLGELGVTVTGPGRWARFNPPITPPLLRRNEVVVPIDPDNLPLS